MVEKQSIDITIPVFNEELDLEKSILTLKKFLDKHLNDYYWVITIADNASTDKTLDIAKKLAHKYSQVKYVHLNQKGRGRAVKTVWQHSSADYLAYMDVDLSSDLNHLPNIINALARGYDIAIGSRNKKESRVYGRSLLRTITSKGYMILIKIFFWVNFSDAQCGFKAVTKEVVKKLIPMIQDNGWFFDSELLIVGEKNGYRIYDEPVTWIDNPGSTVRVLKTAQGDLEGLWRLFITRPWKRN
jgi:glycosyltransferase involved in cell wall biosynthesis